MHSGDVCERMQSTQHQLHTKPDTQTTGYMNGVFPNFFDPKTGDPCTEQRSVSENADSFFEYVLKSYLQTQNTENWCVLWWFVFV